MLASRLKHGACDPHTPCEDLWVLNQLNPRQYIGPVRSEFVEGYDGPPCYLVHEKPSCSRCK